MLSHGLLLVMTTSSSPLVRISGCSKCGLYSYIHSVIERALDLHSIHSFLIVFP